ncbi:MAG TPA: helix-turn-helix domain-containing protein, partial [Gemmataceae bacterium]|nr:helix-turn-helix domain-containing protein [Gemmataceae bacterium]
QTDVRVIAATNKKLEELLAVGRLRQDLYYRLKVYTIHLPPLRERQDDLPLLVDHFLRLLNRDLGKSVTSVSPEAMRALEKHEWPGNVRELQSALKYALVQTAGDVLTPDALPEMIQKVPARTPPPVAEQAALDVGQLVSRLLRDGEPDIYRKVCLAVDRAVMEAVLRYAKGNQVQASELLGISRTTLRGKLRVMGMAIEKQLLSDSDQDD